MIESNHIYLAAAHGGRRALDVEIDAVITKTILRVNLPIPFSLIEIRHIASLTIFQNHVEQSLIERVQIPAGNYVLKWICNTAMLALIGCSPVS